MHCLFLFYVFGKSPWDCHHYICCICNFTCAWSSNRICECKMRAKSIVMCRYIMHFHVQDFELCMLAVVPSNFAGSVRECRDSQWRGMKRCGWQLNNGVGDGWRATSIKLNTPTHTHTYKHVIYIYTPIMKYIYIYMFLFTHICIYIHIL